MPQDLKIGMVGLDTSHVSAFTGLLNDPNKPYHVPGGKVVIAFPGGSKDFEASYSRVEKFTTELRDKYGVKIADSPEAVAEACDVLLIESVDGRVHLDQLKRTIKFKRPTFIDKPLATSYADAQAIFRLAHENGIPLMTCSSLRYAQPFVDAVNAVGKDKILSCDVFGPMAEQPTQPGLFWYGIHTVEMIVAAMGPKCVEVRSFKTDRHDVHTFLFEDGRLATLHGLREQHGKFGAVLHSKDGPTLVNAYGGPKPPYASMLEAILASLPNGRSAVPQDESLAIIRIIEAANQDRATNQPVRI